MIKLRNSIALLFLAMSLCQSAGVLAQISLSKSDVGLIEGEYSRCRMDYVNIGDSGPNCFWDFSSVSEKDFVNISIKDSLNVLISTDNDQVKFYHCANDTLMELGRECPLAKIFYTRPVCKLIYPLSYQNSWSSNFEGYGVYCGDHLFRETGENKSIVDAYGSIVMPSGDTLRNVLRVYTLKSYMVNMDNLSECQDSAIDRQIIEESYAWYLKNHHQPIVETIFSCSYIGMQPVGSSQISYLSFPSFADREMENGCEAYDNTWKNSGIDTPNDIIHYKVDAGTDLVSVNYDLDERANVSMLLANNMGMVFYSTKSTKEKGTGYQETFDLAGLREGVYILYINVNGKIYNEKVNK